MDNVTNNELNQLQLFTLIQTGGLNPLHRDHPLMKLQMRTNNN